MISDNGPQFVAREFKQFIRISGMDHVRTSPYYPQSNGKIERWHGSLKAEAIRPKTPLSLADARRVVGEFVQEYNATRLHSAIGYVTPQDRLEGRHTQIWEERDRKLEAARAQRAARREQARERAGAADVESDNVRVVTAYLPDPNEWESDLKARRPRQSDAGSAEPS